MKVNEYQAKGLFKSFAIPVPEGKVAQSPQQAGAIAQALGFPVVIKAQVTVGGRGKAGGVKIAANQAEAVTAADRILGMTIKGLQVENVLIEQAAAIEQEYYISIILDRQTGKIVLMASKEGGVEIEQVAKERPEAIKKIYISPAHGLRDYQCMEVGFFFFAELDKVRALKQIIKRMYALFVSKDAGLVEINPLVVNQAGALVALDAKILFDDNALYRQRDIERLREPAGSEILELEAKEAGLSFIPLQGDIGCMVNGAGLAMATMDIIKKYSGEPANFLDIGGSSNPQKVVKAFDIILRDKQVKAIFINIFGGITRCDDVAKGIVAAFNTLGVKVPVVVRLTGTNEQQGKDILQHTSLLAATSMSQGAKQAVALAQGGTA